MSNINTNDMHAQTPRRTHELIYISDTSENSIVTRYANDTPPLSPASVDGRTNPVANTLNMYQDHLVYSSDDSFVPPTPEAMPSDADDEAGDISDDDYGPQPFDGNRPPNARAVEVAQQALDRNKQAWQNRKFITRAFVINNYTEHAVRHLIRKFQEGVDNGLIAYACFGKEVAPSTGTPHLQGYVRLSHRIYMYRWMTEIFDQANMTPCYPDLEVASYGDEANMRYCSKTRPGDTPNEYFVEFGTIKRSRKRGKRTDLTEMTHWIMNNPNTEIAEFISMWPNCWIRYQKAIEKTYEIARQNAGNDLRKKGVKVYWHFGETATGKSKWLDEYVKANFDKANVYNKEGGKWWCGYNTQRCVKMDDFRGSDMTLKDLLKLCDKYDFTPERKGGRVNVVADTVIITCDQHPAKVYARASSKVEQLLRRIYETEGDGHIVQHFRTPNAFGGYSYSTKTWTYEMSKNYAQVCRDDTSMLAQAPGFRL